MGSFGMEAVGEPAARQVLPADRRGQAAAGAGAFPLAAADPGDQRSAGTAQTGERVMISRWFSRRRREELDEELASHLKMAAEDRIARGEAQTRAKEAARRELGNLDLIREVTVDMWGG